MNELIKIENREGIETVNARELHEFLEVGRDFSSWIKQRIKKYDFEENVDYTCTPDLVSSSSGTKHSISYYISLDMAKELSMVENNEKGREARKYFIVREKQARELEKKAISSPNFNNPAEAARAWADEYEAKQKAIEAEKRTDIRLKRVIHNNKTFSTTEIAKELGMTSANVLNQKLHEKGIQYKNASGVWMLYSEYMNKELSVTKSKELDNGKIVYYLRWTGIGRDYILGLFSKDTI